MITRCLGVAAPAPAGRPDVPNPAVRRRAASTLQLGHRRVLQPGRLRPVRAVAWLVGLVFVTAAAFGLPLQWLLDHVATGNAPAQLAARLAACASALGCYALAVRLGEGRRADEVALWSAPAGLLIGVHASWNLAQGYLFGAPVSGTDLGGSVAVSTARAGAPLWLTGGAFGPEASVVALILVTAVTLSTLILLRRRPLSDWVGPEKSVTATVLTCIAGR